MAKDCVEKTGMREKDVPAGRRTTIHEHVARMTKTASGGFMRRAHPITPADGGIGNQTPLGEDDSKPQSF